MKYLQDYLEKNQTECFEKFGVFFAFSTKQFDEAKVEGTMYVNMGMGMLCPKEHVKQFIEEHHEIVIAGLKQDVEENGAEEIIKRELYNYESFYTGDPSDAIDALKDYEFSEELINKVWREEQIKVYADENN